MVSAAVLLISGLLVGFVAPRVLRRIDPATHDPTLLIVAWLAAVTGVFAAALGSVFVLVHPEHGMGLIPSNVASHNRWHPFAHGAPTVVEQLAGVFVAVLLSIGALWLGHEIAAVRRRRIRASDAHVAMLRIVGHSDPAMPNILRMDHDEPVAFSISGHGELVIATEGVFRLGDAAAAAVIAHERAHLRGRHHALLEWARILGNSIPHVPVFRHLPSALAELVELSADRSAAKECGDEAVYSALIRMSDRPHSPIGLGMGDHAIERRLARLSRRGSRHCRAARYLLWSGVAATWITVPFFVMLLLLHVTYLFR